ncbi:MAG: type II toxin-antitoxin system PemK/MazF family toxin [Gammaproteobacteria bacterium]|nr:type II toxin-antitoxin system PemK/MazF family toxin [Gammaproteobacteria bacterium]
MYKKGELILIPYPYTDLSSQKRRPVLIISNIDRNGDFIALPVTSKNYHINSVPLKGKLLEGSLPKDSWVRTDHIVTLNQSIVVKSFAKTQTSFVSSMINDICIYLDKDSKI